MRLEVGRRYLFENAANGKTLDKKCLIGTTAAAAAFARSDHDAQQAVVVEIAGRIHSPLTLCSLLLALNSVCCCADRPRSVC